MERIPFTVIGGYLGAGKTTLLNHILRNSDGRRYALLINDFGSINIDAELVESQDGDTMNLANGCICCTLAAGFVVAIKTVLEREPLPDHVIVEASGVADPHKIAQYGRTPRFYLDGVIVVADAETVRAKAVDKYVGRTVLRQLESADLIILNKTDLVTQEQRQKVRDWLARAAPQSRIIEAQHGAVPLEVLLGSRGEQEFAAVPGDDGHDHQHDEEFASGSYVDDTPLQREQFERFLAELPESVVRAKGILNLAEDPERRTIFQLVGDRWSLNPGRPWGDEQPQSRIVWIGLADRDGHPVPGS
jgi:G3E family GTPase